jgi:hypothetical protein
VGISSDCTPGSVTGSEKVFVAVSGVAMDAVDGFVNNAAAGNAGGNYLRVLKTILPEQSVI